MCVCGLRPCVCAGSDSEGSSSDAAAGEGRGAATVADSDSEESLKTDSDWEDDPVLGPSGGGVRSTPVAPNHMTPGQVLRQQYRGHALGPPGGGGFGRSGSASALGPKKPYAGTGSFGR